jgi:hypothetical protein
MNDMKHVVIYREKGRYAGWPANSGIWVWGDEILVGFQSGHFNLEETWGHPMDTKMPCENLLARSLDGGEHWSIETPGELNKDVSSPNDLKEPVDFTHPDFAMTLRMSSYEGDTDSWFYYSYNRGRSWEGPCRLNGLDSIKVAARTDYIVEDARTCLAFLTAMKSDGKEGRPFCAATEDGGLTWAFRGWIGDEPDGHAIMPSTVKLSDGRLLTAVRRLEGHDRTAAYWIDTFLSRDRGSTWEYWNRPVEHFGGNPPAMIKLNDSRICLTYGFREKPFGIRARVSHNNGSAWNGEVILRNDGGGGDLGYPRTVQRKDGKIVTVYYFNDSPDTERYIAGTIWSLE